MIKRSAAEKVMDNRRRIISELISRQTFSVPAAAKHFHVSETAIENDVEDLGLNPDDYRKNVIGEEQEYARLIENFRKEKDRMRDPEILYQHGFYFYPYGGSICYKIDPYQVENPSKFQEAVDYYCNNYVCRSYVVSCIAEKFGVDKSELDNFIKVNNIKRYEKRVIGYPLYKDNKEFLGTIWGERTGDILRILQDSTAKSVAKMLGVPREYIWHLMWKDQDENISVYNDGREKEINNKDETKLVKTKERRELVWKLYYDESMMFSQEVIAALLNTNRTTVFQDLKIYAKEHNISQEPGKRNKHKGWKGEDVQVYLNELKQREGIWSMLEDYSPDRFADRLQAYFESLKKLK